MCENLTININHPALNNVYVRKAISLIIPREHICTNILKGLATPAEQMIPEWSWGHNPNIPPIPYDVEKAKEYMKLAGYDVDLLQAEAEMTWETWLYPTIAGVVVGLLVGAGAVYLVKRTPPKKK